MTALMRLRVGVDPLLGGWLHGVASTCPHCEEATSRDIVGGGGVEHFLKCRGAAAIRARLFNSPEPINPARLWQEESWPAVLQYRQEFAGAQ